MTKKDVDKIVEFIKTYFEANPYCKGAVVGMSGGKDSLIVAKLCTLALGKEKVFGVIMPNGNMADIDDAISSCKLLGINYSTVNIKPIYDSTINSVKNILNDNGFKLNSVSTINTAPRIRMTVLYAIAGSINYLVANTSNLSEAMVGYTTKWGDNVGDFAPIIDFTKTEVCEIGLLLGLPENLVNKAPSDGLSGDTDENKMGLKYHHLDELIRTGKHNEDYEQIMKLHKSSHHKRIGIAKYKTEMKNYLD